MTSSKFLRIRFLLSMKSIKQKKFVHRQEPKLTEEFINEDIKYNDDPFNALNQRLKLLSKKYNKGDKNNLNKLQTGQNKFNYQNVNKETGNDLLLKHQSQKI